MERKVSLLGLGAMGSALASAFMRAGYETTVWNRTPSKATPLTRDGAFLASSPAACFDASPLVIICLLDKTSVEETLRTIPASSFAGKTIVNTTNGTPAHARETLTLITSFTTANPPSTFKYIQAAIMAVPPMIGHPESGSLLLYSGDKHAFEHVSAALSILGTPRFLDADVGTAPLVDLAMLSGMCGMFAGSLHATAMVQQGQGQNQDPDQNASTVLTASQFASELLVPWLHAMADQLRAVAEKVDSGAFGSSGSSLGVILAGLENILSAGEAVGVRSGVHAGFERVLRRRVGMGGEGEDLAALVGMLDMRKGAE